MTTATESLDVLVTGPGAKVSVPTWAHRYAPRVASAAQLGALRELAPLTVVEAGAPGSMLGHQRFLRTLAAKHRETSGPSKILIVFLDRSPLANAKQLARVLWYFQPPEDVEFARGAEQAAFAMEEAFAKILADTTRPTQVAAGRDPLGMVKSVVAATADLRAESGRLSAQKVAEAFGLSLAEVAALLKKKRQAVWKTDDAESLQGGLRPYERIARLRAVLTGSDFRRWLNQPARQLEERSPLDVIRGGEVGVVADLADDMLTGAPG